MSVPPSERGQQPIEMHDGKPFEPGAYENNFALGLGEINLPQEFGVPHKGKVRRTYDLQDGRLAMITTDGLSAFDAGTLVTVPGKGAALNLTSEFWFSTLRDHAAPNHMLEVPHPNIMIVRKAERVVPIEMVIRGYMAKSSTETSVYTHYMRGERKIYGLDFPDGLAANQVFPDGPIITPTTKGETDEMLDDESATRIADGIGGQGTYQFMKRVAESIFDYATRYSRKSGLLLVDTKMEFGLDKNGTLMIIDELLTPDSSRFWEADEYQDRLKEGRPQKMYDKEIVRAWLSNQGFAKGNPIPIIPHEVIRGVSPAYQEPFRRLTGQEFPNVTQDTRQLHQQIVQSMLPYTPKAA